VNRGIAHLFMKQCLFDLNQVQYTPFFQIRVLQFVIVTQ